VGAGAGGLPLAQAGKPQVAVQGRVFPQGQGPFQAVRGLGVLAPLFQEQGEVVPGGGVVGVAGEVFAQGGLGGAGVAQGLLQFGEEAAGGGVVGAQGEGALDLFQSGARLPQVAQGDGQVVARIGLARGQFEAGAKGTWRTASW